MIESMSQSAKSILPQTSVYTRIAVGIVLGFVVLHGFSLVFYGHEKMVSEAGNFAASVVERAMVLNELSHSNPQLIAELESPYFTFEIRDEALARPDRVWPHSDEIRGAVIGQLERMAFERPDQVLTWYTLGRRAPSVFVLQLPLDDENWLHVSAASPVAAQGHTMMAIFWSTLMGLCVLVIVLWVTRRFTSYLPRFATAAEQVGRVTSPIPLEETGPKEMRRLSRAFNTMQTRVTTLLEERNEMLGALSHDVRTLVTRLGLRTDGIADDDQRERARRDITAVTGLLDQALSFARDQAVVEDPVAVDLPSLLQTLVDDQADTGADAGYQGPDSATIEGEPVALRRAFENLIANALRYGGGVGVEVEMLEKRVRVDIVDPGPGIPPDQRVRVLKPFARLETSRSRETGGTGLGLAIAANVIRRHRGTLEFADQPPGFTVRVILPRSHAAR